MYMKTIGPKRRALVQNCERIVKEPVADPELPRQRRQPKTDVYQPIILAIFPRKLHEIENNWTKSCASLVPFTLLPLPSAHASANENFLQRNCNHITWSMSMHCREWPQPLQWYLPGQGVSSTTRLGRLDSCERNSWHKSGIESKIKIISYKLNFSGECDRYQVSRHLEVGSLCVTATESFVIFVQLLPFNGDLQFSGSLALP